MKRHFVRIDPNGMVDGDLEIESGDADALAAANPIAPVGYQMIELTGNQVWTGLGTLVTKLYSAKTGTFADQPKPVAPVNA